MSTTPARRSSAPLILAILAGTAALIAFVFLRVSRDGVHTGPATAQAACAEAARDCLPDVSFVDTNGVAYTRASLAGKIVLINFWATWCKPCEREIPDLSHAFEKYKPQDVVFLGVLIDSPDSQKLLNFQSDHDMRYPVVRATPEILGAYGDPANLPTTMVFDRAGKRVFHQAGMLRDSDLEALFAPLLGPAHS